MGVPWSALKVSIVCLHVSPFIVVPMDAFCAIQFYRGTCLFSWFYSWSVHLINKTYFAWLSGPPNLKQGDAGYQDVIDCATAIAKVFKFWARNSCLLLNWCRIDVIAAAILSLFVLQLLNASPEAILIESTGVIGQRIKKVMCRINKCSSLFYADLLNALPFAPWMSPYTNIRLLVYPDW